MNQENTGLDEIVLEKFAAGGTVEFENYLPQNCGNSRQRFKCYRHGGGGAAFYKPR